MPVTDPDYIHACWMLQRQIDTPADLIRFWRLAGPHTGEQPWIERAKPWYQDLL